MKRLTRLMPLVAAAALAAVMLVPTHAFAKAAIGLSSGSANAVVDAGDTVKGNLDVLNEGDEPMNVLIYAADQKVSATGTVTYLMPTKDSPDFGRTPASWVQIGLPANASAVGNIPMVSIAPGGKVPITYNFQVPNDATPGDYQILIFFEMTNIGAKKGGAVLGRVGSRITVRVKGELSEKLDVAPFSVTSPIYGDKLPYSFQINNTGNTDKKVGVVIALLDSNEAEKTRATILEGRKVYAGTRLAQSGSLNTAGLGFGTYKVRLTLTAPKEGSGEPITVVKDRSVTVVPMWMIYAAIVLVLLLVALAALLIVRAARKRRAPAAKAPAEIEEPLRAAE